MRQAERGGQESPGERVHKEVPTIEERAVGGRWKCERAGEKVF